MKKVLLGVISFFMMLTIVSASENRIYFKDSGNRIYYESKDLGDEFFLNHTNMLPGSSYTDYLTLENGTNKTYTLYFKVKPKEQTESTIELLNATTMNIYLDDNILYSGGVDGINYDDGANLQNAIKLIELKPSSKSRIKVETMLSKNYSNMKSTDISYIDWEFYAQYDEEPAEKINPYTGDNIYIYIAALSVSVIIILIIFFIRKKDKKKVTKK